MKNWIRKFWQGITDFVKENPKEFWILVFILLVAAFCRLYKIDHYMTFLGDEGRDVITVRRLLVEGHPPLIGPGTSIGQMYLGPLYYYMMAPPLLLANFSPVGPAIQIAILGIITVWFVWYVGRKWFGKTAGLISAGLYAIAPTIIIYSRSSWNPNIMPFFALLSMYSIWKVWQEKKMNWLLVLGFSFASVLQSHYLGLLLVPSIGIFWLLTLFSFRSNGKWKMETGKFLQKSLYAFLIFVALMSPLFFFDIRHNYINAKALYTFLTVRQETVSIKPWTAIPKAPEILNLINNSVVAAKDMAASIVASVLIVIGLIWVFVNKYRKNKNFLILPQYWLLISWIGFGLLGFGLYKQHIYDHYFGFLFAVPFLLIGSFTSALFKDGKLFKIAGILLVGYLIVINLINSPLRKEPNSLLQRSEDVSHKIVTEAEGQQMNLAVIADSNYEAGYQYFVELYGGKVLLIDAQDKSTFANQLFVVCELIPTTKCDPTHNPKAQVANFGWSKVDAHWDLDGVIIYRLIHTKP